MKLEALPYYPWRVIDFRASRKVQRLGYIARGFYRELLDEEWVEGSLPLDLSALAEICGCSLKVMEKAWPELKPCFVETAEGRLINVKLEGMRTAKDAERVDRARAGRAGGLAKKAAADAKTNKAEISMEKAGANSALASASTCHIGEKREKRKEKVAAQAPFPLPEWIPADSWNGWDDMRRKARKPLTDRSRSLAVRELEKLRDAGEDVGAVIDRATLKGWMSFYPLNAPNGADRSSTNGASQAYRNPATLYDGSEYQPRQTIGRPA
jgi:uncharacterized protein YdaU (DUF1376 family)